MPSVSGLCTIFAITRGQYALTARGVGNILDLEPKSLGGTLSEGFPSTEILTLVDVRDLSMAARPMV